MSAGKIGCLVLYAVLAAVAVLESGTNLGNIAGLVLLALAFAHLLEMVVYFRLCQQAGGSLAAQLLQVFVFGYFHMIEMKAAVDETQTPP